jgi:hypothetical protein
MRQAHAEVLQLLEQFKIGTIRNFPEFLNAARRVLERREVLSEHVLGNVNNTNLLMVFAARCLQRPQVMSSILMGTNQRPHESVVLDIGRGLGLTLDESRQLAELVAGREFSIHLPKTQQTDLGWDGVTSGRKNTSEKNAAKLVRDTNRAGGSQGSVAKASRPAVVTQSSQEEDLLDRIIQESLNGFAPVEEDSDLYSDDVERADPSPLTVPIEQPGSLETISAMRGVIDHAAGVPMTIVGLEAALDSGVITPLGYYRRKREEKGKSVEGLSQQTGIPVDKLKRLEEDPDYHLAWPDMKKLATAYGIPPQLLRQAHSRATA